MCKTISGIWVNGMKKNKRRTAWLLLGRLQSKAGMSLTELLAGILILSMVGLVVTGGVTVVKNVYQKVIAKAEAQQVLVTTVELVTAELSGALEVEEKDGVLCILSEKNGLWFSLQSSDETGICKTYDEDTAYPLLSSGAMGKRFYTTFGSCSYEDGCFIITNIGVYDKRQKETDDAIPTPAAELSELKIRAVNLEGT